MSFRILRRLDSLDLGWCRLGSSHCHGHRWCFHCCRKCTSWVDPRWLEISSLPLSYQFYTTLSDLWAKSEQLWEGIFSIIAAVLIYVMGLAFLKMDRSRVKWRIKLAQAFDNKVSSTGLLEEDAEQAAYSKKEARNGKWALFLLPFITVLREGVEAVVFVGGVSARCNAVGIHVEAVLIIPAYVQVSLGQSGTSIPIATIVGLIAGAAVGEWSRQHET